MFENMFEIIINSLVTSGILITFGLIFFRYYIKNYFQKDSFRYKTEKKSKSKSYKKLIKLIDEARHISKDIANQQKDYAASLIRIRQVERSLINCYFNSLRDLLSGEQTPNEVSNKIYSYYNLIRDFWANLEDNPEFSDKTKSEELKKIADQIQISAKECEELLSQKK